MSPEGSLLSSMRWLAFAMLNTHGNEFENFINQENRCADIQDGLPFCPVEWRDLEEGLNKVIRNDF